MAVDIDGLREKLMDQGIALASMHTDPYKQFEQWFSLAIESHLDEPNAMCLATVDEQGQPWQRMVLLKTYDENGFIFFTNYESRKAIQINANHKVCILFPWHALGRQVIITGQASRISASESLNYFVTRSRGSQIGAWASPQSRVITTRAILESMVDKIKARFKEGSIPLPPHWGGFRIKPGTFEFWQSRQHRLHDRFQYSLNESGDWYIERLAP